MKYNWPAVMKELKKILIENVKIFHREYDKNPSEAWINHLKAELSHTDRFHPVDCEQYLCKMLNRIPDRCNYRSVKSYWDYKHAKSSFFQEADNCLREMQEYVQDYYSTMWNFAPGTKVPEKIYISEFFSDRTLARILRAAKQPTDHKNS